MPLQDLRAIYEVLFRDGVMVAKKDKRPQIKHPEVQGVRNLQVIRAMMSLKSRGYVTETFAWRHFYWYLTNDGIVYLRDYLRLPAEIVPASLQRIRKPAATLAIAHRAARVQSVEGPTSYVPKPGRRVEGESQEADRQSYRHKTAGARERESYSDMTPRFRGRPLTAEPVRQKASWEVENQAQHLFRKGTSEVMMMEQNRMKRQVSQEPDLSYVKTTTSSREMRVLEVKKEKIPSSVSVQTAALKQDVSQATPSKTALPLNAAAAEAAGAATSIPAEPSTPKTKERKKKEKPKSVSEKASVETTEEKLEKAIVEPIKSLEVNATANEKANSKPLTATVSAQESCKALTDTATAKTVMTKPVNKDVKQEKTAKVIVQPVEAAEVNARVKTASETVASKPVSATMSAQETSKALSDTATTSAVNTQSANKDVKEDKARKVNADPVQSEVTKTADTHVQAEAVTIVELAQEASKVVTSTAAPVITKPVYKEGKLKKANLNEESVKPTEVKTQCAVESKIVQDKEEKTTKLKPHGTASKPEGSKPKGTNKAEDITKAEVTQEPLHAKVTSGKLSTQQKTDDVPLAVTESSTLEVKTVITTTLLAPLSSEDAQPVTGTLAVKTTTQNEKVQLEEAPKVMVMGPSIVQEESGISQLAQYVITEVVKDTKQVAEGSSKSKRKKKKPLVTNAEETADSRKEKEKSLEVSENTTPVITSEPLTLASGKKTVEQIKEVSKQTNGKPKEMVLKETITISEASLPLVQIPALPLVDTQVKEKVKESNVSQITQGALCPKGELNAALLQMEPMKFEEMNVTKVETVTVQKRSRMEIMQATPKPDEKTPALQSESQKPPETKSIVSAEKSTEIASKGKKKGKGKKQAKDPESEAINTKSEADVLPSIDMTSLPKATVKESPVTTSELTKMNVSPKLSPESMCSKEVRQAAAVLSEAPADKGEVEPALLPAEKIKREVPKPETSSTAREAAGELASAALAVTAQAAVTQTQASPLSRQEEPPKVAQHTATKAAECSTEEKRSVSQALKQEGEKKRDLRRDTPSATATATPAAQPDQPHLEDTSESTRTDTDDTIMKRKIVVVEEIVEVKQLIKPDESGEQSPPPPVPPEVEGEDLDLDVLEEIAIERALLSGVAAVSVQGASPEADWDHSLEEPEGKTWPNFVEGLNTCQFTSFLSCTNLSDHVMQVLFPPFFVVWEVLGGVFHDGSIVASHHHALTVYSYSGNL